MKAIRIQQQDGMSLLETMIAVGILLVAMAAMMSLFTVAVSQNANQGEFATRATEYAGDKMEQLLALPYDSSSLGGGAMAVGGYAGNLNSPVAPYVDYLDASGNTLTSSTSANWFYQRRWRIDQVATNLKQISVIALVRAQAGRGTLPSTTVVTLKANLP